MFTTIFAIYIIIGFVYMYDALVVVSEQALENGESNLVVILSIMLTILVWPLALL